MLDTDWVKHYLNRILSADLEKEADDLLAEKMTHINKPFYKYCYVCEENKLVEGAIDYNMENFKNDELFFKTQLTLMIRLLFFGFFTSAVSTKS